MSGDSHTENDLERNEVPAEDALEQAQSDAGGASEAADVVQDDSPETRIAALEEEVRLAKDQALRAAADAQNARRRAEQDAEKARKFALERFIKELLPVVDSLEKALESLQNDENASVHREGLEMTLNMQLSALEKFGVKPLQPQGEPFDPQFHEAMTMVPNPAVAPNTVMDVLQKGYTLNDRLVRPAMVVVSKD